MVEVIDFGAYRRNTAIKTLESRPKQWTSGLYDYQITALSVSDKAVMVDLRVSRGGVILLDDRIWVGNPPTMTGDGIFKTYSKYINPDQPENPQWFTDDEFAKLARVDQKAYVPTGDRGPRDTMVFDPWGAMQKTLEQVFSIVTKNGPRIERIVNSDRFRGDTLAQRSSTADGRINSGPAANWGACADGVARVANTTGTSAFGTQATFVTPDYDCHASFFDFDTSSLGAGASVSTAVFTLYGEGTAEVNTNSLTMQARIYNWGGTLTTADWRDRAQLAADSLFATMAVSSWNQTNNTANNFTSDAGAPALVNKVGTTYLVLTLSNFPTGGAAPTGNNKVETYMAEFAGTTSDPLLTVTYTPGSTRGSNLTRLGVS